MELQARPILLSTAKKRCFCSYHSYQIAKNETKVRIFSVHDSNLIFTEQITSVVKCLSHNPEASGSNSGLEPALLG
jgi:hypothetical protein